MAFPVDLLMGEGHRQTAVAPLSWRREGSTWEGLLFWIPASCFSGFQPDEHLQARGTACAKPWGRGKESEYVSGFLKIRSCPLGAFLKS